MRVTYLNGQFLCHCNFNNRDLPKWAGFHWNQKDKIWSSLDASHAARLRDYCDETAKKEIDKILLSLTPWTGGVVIPNGLTLFPFQEEAIQFALERNRSYLALDPGLGKTICAAVICGTLNASCLYVCPPFLVENVKEEFKKWAPNVDLIVAPDTQLLKFTHTGSDILVVDEAHRFKTDTALRTKALYNKLFPRFDRSIFMSGTPMPNSPIELHTVLFNAAPELIDFKDKFQYGMRYCAAHKNHFGWDFSGSSHLLELVEKVKPFMLRIKKKDVLPQLPPKTEGMVILEHEMPAHLAKMDRDLLRLFSPEDLMGSIAPNGHIATYRKELGVAKVSMSVTFIRSILEETDESILVFAIHKEVVAKLLTELIDYSPYVVTGDTPMKNRQDFVDGFQKDGTRVFIGNIAALGTGFTLTKATRVVFVEFSWTPSDNDQAIDRCHRIGQSDNVLAHFLVYKNSVDRAVLETVFRKKKVTGCI